MKVIVIGAGHWGQNLVRTFYELGALAGVAETSEALREKLYAKYPDLRIYSSYQEAIRESEALGIVIATPAPKHFEIAKYALKNGRDVFVEKPITLNSEDAETLVRIAEREGRLLMTGHLLLYQPAIQRIKALVDEGAIGKLHAIHQERMKLGRVRSVENVLWSFGVHDIAVMLFLSQEEPAEVISVGQRILQSGIEDDVQLHLRFPSGLTASLHVSWLWPEQRRRLVLVGDRGMLAYDEERQTVTLHNKGINADLSIRDEGSEVVFEGADKPLTLECLHFLECLKERRRPLSDGIGGLQVVRVLERAYSGSANKDDTRSDYYAHPTAVIDAGAVIGKGAKIWHFSHVMPGAVIGERSSLGQNVYVAGSAIVGRNVKIQNNVSIYDGVVLEDDVFCGPSMVFTNVKTLRSAYPRNTSDDYLRTLVRQGASIGANATIVCGTTIGLSAMVAAGAVVAKNVPDYALVAGVPAKQLGWVCECGERLELKKNERAQCECGQSYRLNEGNLRKL